MIVNKRRNSYKILFAGNGAYMCSNSRYGTVDLYDSMTKSWSLGQNMSVGSTMKRGAYYGGEFYILTIRSWRGPYAVEILDLTTLDGGRNDPFVVACLGRIYLVGGSYPLASIVIFQLDQCNRWTKISEYPDEHFFGFSRVIYGCVSNGLKIYVVTKLGSMLFAVYNCATSCWEWEKPIHKGSVRDMQNIIQTKLTFHPNFQVAP